MRECKNKREGKKGLTLIEIIVVAGIIGVMITVTIANYLDYEQKNVVGNLAQDVALSIRLAQSYGLNVRGNPFNSSYGISFSQGANYFIYRDTNRITNGFRSDVDAVTLETFSLGQGYRIEDVCVNNGVDTCLGGGFTRLDITFDRPKPDANFRTNTGGINYDYADIVITSPKGDTRTVRVRATGYINVE